MKCIVEVCILCLMCCFTTKAQERETPVPMDLEGRIMFITSAMEDTLKVFQEYGNFVEAHLYMREDTSCVLEISQMVDGRPERIRKKLREDEVFALRKSVSRRLAVSVEIEPHFDQSGRSKFLTTTTLLSLGYYGWAVPYLINASDAKESVVLYFLTSGCGFLVPYLLTENTDMTEGMAIMAAQGGVRGIVDGFFIDWMIRGDLESMSKGESRTLIAAGAIGSIAEMVIGCGIARSARFDAGRASTLSLLGNYGLGFGLGAYYTVDDKETDHLPPVFGLLGSAAGYWLGDVLTRSEHYTEGDATVLSNTIILGAGVPTAIASLSESEEGRLYAVTALLGSAGGFVLGNLLLKGREFTSSEGAVTTLGAVGGGLVGLGFAVGFARDNSPAGVYLTGAALGAAAGFALVFNVYKDVTKRPGRSSSWKMSFSPAGLLTAIGPMKGKTDMPIPLVMLSARL